MKANKEQVQIWNKIRTYYKENIERIRGDYPLNGDVVYDIQYQCGYKETPIEYDVYCHIKCFGIPVVCPQFPVKNYFIDFADPIAKVGIEADGAYFHSDKLKESLRDQDLENEGWWIYHIEGKYAHHGCTDCYYEKVCDDVKEGYYSHDELVGMYGEHFDFYEQHKERCCAGIMQRIRDSHYKGSEWRWRGYPRHGGIVKASDVMQDILARYPRLKGA